MANNRAIRIAEPILRKSYNAETGAPLRPAVRAITSDLLDALRAASPPLHPCVIEDWQNEPIRRAGIVKMRGERAKSAARRRAADKKRQEAKAARMKKLHRIAKGIQRAAKRVGNFMRRAAFKKAARGQ